jgi:4-amino-4-deoxy-L-arabinose transferase-like glycosyltransferase
MSALSSSKQRRPVDAVLWAAVLAMTAVYFILMLHNLGSLSLWMDEGFHAIASQEIRAHGVPLFPSGHMYYKAILYTYVLALITAVFGQSEFTLRIVSLAAVAAGLPLLFHMVRKYFSRWAALAAVVIIALSPWVAENARLALYFAPLQLFYLLSLFFFHRGFFEDHKPSRFLAVLFFILTPQVHQLGMGVWFCFPALLLLRGLRNFFRKAVIWPFLVVTAFYGLMQVSEFFFWKVGYVYAKTDTSLRGMVSYFFGGFSLDYFKEFFRSFPWMSLAVLAGLFLCLGARRVVGEDEDEARLFRERWLFFNMCLVFPLVFLGFFRTHVQPRYLFQLYSVFVVLFCVGLLVLGRVLVEEFLWPLAPGLKKRPAATRALGVVAFAGLAVLLADNIGLGRVRAVVERHYGDPIAAEIITRSGRFEHYDHKGIGLYVKHFLEPKDDIVIAIHVVFGHVYAGRVDYWLWSGGPGTWDAWEKTPDGWKDFYVGARWLNSLEGLRGVIDSNPGRRVWLIASPSLGRRDHISRDIADFILSDPSRLVFRGKDGMSAVFLWNERPPALTAGGHALEAEWLPARSSEVVFGGDLSKSAALRLIPGGKKEIFRCELPRLLPAGRYRLRVRAVRPPSRRGVPPHAETAGEAGKALGLTVLDGAGGGRLRTVFLTAEEAAGAAAAQADFVLPRERRPVFEFVYDGSREIWLDWLDVEPASDGRTP